MHPLAPEMSRPQVIALLRIAQKDLWADLDNLIEQGVHESPETKYLEALIHALTDCEMDLCGKDLVPTNTSARSVLIRKGYVHQNLYGAKRPGLRFQLTPLGREWCKECAAACEAVRALLPSR